MNEKNHANVEAVGVIRKILYRLKKEMNLESSLELSWKFQGMKASAYTNINVIVKLRDTKTFRTFMYMISRQISGTWNYKIIDRTRDPIVIERYQSLSEKEQDFENKLYKAFSDNLNDLLVCAKTKTYSIHREY